MGEFANIDAGVKNIVAILLETNNMEPDQDQVREIERDVAECVTGWIVEGSLPLQPGALVRDTGLLVGYGVSTVTRSIVQTFMESAGITNKWVTNPESTPFIAMEIGILPHLPVEIPD